jgi:hypothetical protein
MEQQKMQQDISVNTRDTNTDQHDTHTDHQEQENTSFVAEVAESIKGTAEGDEAARQFLLRVVQPGLAGLMDGSVSTLAPIFATAFTIHLRPFWLAWQQPPEQVSVWPSQRRFPTQANLQDEGIR